MTVTTKLNVGDLGVFIHNDMVQALKVDKVEVFSTVHGTSVYYSFNTGKSDPVTGSIDRIQKNEKVVFATKSELLESL